MAIFQFEFSRDDRRKLGGGEDFESNDFFCSSRQAGAVTQGLFSWWCSWESSLDFRGENPRCELRWLYLAMTGLYWSPY
jgi:hypothetical protein